MGLQPVERLLDSSLSNNPTLFRRPPVVVGCTNELNSILPSTTFSLDSAEAGVAEQERTTIFHLSSPPKIFTHEDGLQRVGWQT